MSYTRGNNGYYSRFSGNVKQWGEKILEFFEGPRPGRGGGLGASQGEFAGRFKAFAAAMAIFSDSVGPHWGTEAESQS